MQAHNPKKPYKSYILSPKKPFFYTLQVDLNHYIQNLNYYKPLYYPNTYFSVF